MRVYLFDIDGTLIRSSPNARRALSQALYELTGQPAELSELDLAGRTDCYILKLILNRYAGGYSPTKYQQLLSWYLQFLEENIRQNPPEILPGVEPLLKFLAQQENTVLGLLTGNVPEGARLKLGPLFHYFSFGIYGDHTEQREALGLAARAMVEKYTGYPVQELVVIGDTPHDISCARAGRAKVIAVATGQFSRHELSAADAILNSLEEWPYWRFF